MSIFLLFVTACTDDIINTPPSASDQTITIEENLPESTIITAINGRDQDGDELIYSIVSGNVDDAFILDGEGLLTVNNEVAIDFERYPSFNLSVLISDGIDEVDITITILLTDVDEEDFNDLTEEEIQIINYFAEISLGFEFGSSSRITRKWKDTMNVFVSGDTTEVLMLELQSIISELNELITDGFYIRRVSLKSNSNMHVFFGSGSDYASQYPGAEQFVSGNWGLFFVNWDSDQNLNTAHLYVDTDRANEIAQRHLLREEFTQSLGLARDADTYPGSIFLSSWSTTTEYLPIDREIISLLYHPWMTSGLGEVQAKRLAGEILRQR